MSVAVLLLGLADLGDQEGVVSSLVDHGRAKSTAFHSMLSAFAIHNDPVRKTCFDDMECKGCAIFESKMSASVDRFKRTVEKLAPIPKDIHVTWKTKFDVRQAAKTSRLMRLGLSRLQQMNRDWTIHVYDDNDINKELQGWLSEKDWALILGRHIVEKSDLWRLLKMYHAGGMYVDIDRLHDQKLDRIIDLQRTKMALPVCGLPPSLRIRDFSQDIMLSAPKNPVFKLASDWNLHLRRMWVACEDSNKICDVCGGGSTCGDCTCSCSAHHCKAEDGVISCCGLSVDCSALSSAKCKPGPTADASRTFLFKAGAPAYMDAVTYALFGHEIHSMPSECVSKLILRLSQKLDPVVKIYVEKQPFDTFTYRAHTTQKEIVDYEQAKDEFYVQNQVPHWTVATPTQNKESISANLSTLAMDIASMTREQLGLPLYSCKTCPLCFNWQYNHTLGDGAYGCSIKDVTATSVKRDRAKQPIAGIYDSTIFLQKMRNRTLVFTGDSLGQEHFMSLGCMLLASGSVVPEISTTKDLWMFKAFFSKYNFTMAYYKSNRLDEVMHIPGKKGGGFTHAWSSLLQPLRKEDVVVANWGAWFNANQSVWHMQTATALKQTYQSVLRQINAIPEERRPRVIMRESSAQHFDSPGGLWPGKGMPLANSGSCTSKPVKEMMAYNWRNRAVEPLLRTEGYEIMRVYRSTANMADFHVRGHHDKHGHLVHDCTHYCLPGPVIDHWSYLLYAAVVTTAPPLQAGAYSHNDRY